MSRETGNSYRSGFLAMICSMIGFLGPLWAALHPQIEHSGNRLLEMFSLSETISQHNALPNHTSQTMITMSLNMMQFWEEQLDEDWQHSLRNFW
ncbi:MAG: hypothetical protein ACOH2H_19810 [Cypionkella sp.]